MLFIYVIIADVVLSLNCSTSERTALEFPSTAPGSWEPHHRWLTIRASVRKGSIVTVDAHSISVQAHSVLKETCVSSITVHVRAMLLEYSVCSSSMS